MPDENSLIVTAPYVARRTLKTRDVFVRLDQPSAHGRKVAVRHTAEVASLLSRFRSPTTVSDVLTEAPAEERARCRSIVAALLEAGFLVSFGTDRLPPPSLELELTNVCNAACRMCPRDGRPAGMMSDETFERVTELAARGQGVILQGMGEPTLHPRLAAYLARLRAVLGDEVPLAVVTNGFRMTAARYEEVLAAGADLVQWSFHSLKASVYNDIMQATQFERAKANLEACAAVDAGKLSINFVEMLANKAEYGRIVTWAGSLGIPPGRVGRIPVFSRGGAVDSVTLGGIDRAARGGRCVAARKALFLAWNGDVIPCSNDIAGTLTFANLHTDTPATILRRWQHDVLAKEFQAPVCLACDHFRRDTLDTAWFDGLAPRVRP